MARIYLYGGRLCLVDDPANTSSAYVANLVRQCFLSSFEHTAKHEVNIAYEPILNNGVGGRLGHIKEVGQTDFQDGKFYLSSTRKAEYIHFVYIESEQVFLVEKNTSVFPNPVRVFSYLEDYLDTRIALGRVSIKPLTEPGNFWDVVHDSKSIYRVTLTLDPPNFLGTLYASVKERLEELQKQTQADEYEEQYKNSNGKLVINNEHFQPFIEWIEDGGGDWEVEAEIGAIRRVYKSTDTVSLYTFEVPDRKSVDASTLKRMRDLDLGVHSVHRRA